MPRNYNHNKDPFGEYWEPLFDGIAPIYYEDRTTYNSPFRWSLALVEASLSQAEKDASIARYTAHYPIPTEYSDGKTVTWRIYQRPSAHPHEWFIEHHRRRYFPITFENNTYSCTRNDQHSIDQLARLAREYLQFNPTRPHELYWCCGGAEEFRFEDINHISRSMSVSTFIAFHNAIIARNYKLRLHARKAKNIGTHADFEHDRHWPGYVEPVEEPDEPVEEPETDESDEDKATS